ncbi:DcaP family trimeric outer membrane transporter [Rhodopirellula sp. MGV]|uniref:DcaP family trimeric outer membrane transporter n=1 Tax=Rhodopirellula sp. MGV TaxID=2023130 RepID=UPI0018E93624|nr:DcaP family trimeric outer membrane transporter [Rhodopirellula sp. MGV]
MPHFRLSRNTAFVLITAVAFATPPATTAQNTSTNSLTDPKQITSSESAAETDLPLPLRYQADGISDGDVMPGASGLSAADFRTADFDGGLLKQHENDFTAVPEFSGGIVIVGDKAAMKIGGFIKADFISDLAPIESEDSFITTDIPVGVADYQNARFHAKQSRLSFDTRWRVEQDIARAFVEADFFGGGDGANGSLRLRHAYGTLGRFTAGQTWTTFTDPSAVPQTLDFEGAVSNVNRRQGLVRFDQPLGRSGWSWAASLEDPTIDIEVPTGLSGQPRSESPDFITHLRWEGEYAETQTAVVLRKLGFQQAGQEVITGTAWGVNTTGSFRLTDCTRVYSQLTVGEGIGSYRGSPDIVSTGPNSAAILPMFGWMIGCKQTWSDRLTSNLTFSQLTLDDIAGQSASNLRQTKYLAINTIFNPYERVFAGAEYLYGMRENQDSRQADAHRIQISFGFYLP